jgi:ketosteroid isomerase-like protein
VWRKRPDGTWRVLLDIGTSHALPPAEQPAGESLTTGPDHAWAARGPLGRPPADLIATDRAYRDEVGRSGPSALQTWGAADMWLLSEGSAPIIGRPQAQVAIARRAALVELSPLGAHVSASDDLGCTYGVLVRAAGDAPDSSVFMHVWRREADGAWRMALVVENPLETRR